MKKYRKDLGLELNNTDYEYSKLLRDVLDNGHIKSDRTGTGTISTFGRQIRFNMQDSFPVFTTKKIFTKAVFHELLWFLNGDTNIQYLVQNGVNIWNADAYKKYQGSQLKSKGAPKVLSMDEFVDKVKTDDEFAKQYGDLGVIYGYQWINAKNNSKPIKILPRIIDYVKEPKVNKICLESSNSTIFTSKTGCKYIILKSYDKQVNDKKRTLCDIQFDDGYIKSNVRLDAAKEERVKNPYARNRCGVGYYGENHNSDKALIKRWNHMISICYDENNKEYPYYGGKGVFVSTDWLCYANYERDVKHLPNWAEAKKNLSKFELDKDYFSSNCYSKDTCVWLSKNHNILYARSSAFIAIYPDGTKSEILLSKSNFADINNLQVRNINRCLSGERKQHKKFKFENVYDDHLYRYPLPINQIQNLIDRLQTNPDCRRIMVNAWNVAEISEMTLPPCHYGFQVWTRELTLEERFKIWFDRDKPNRDLVEYFETKDAQFDFLDERNIPKREISLMFNMRSVDCGLGLPFDVTSYGFLLEMIAQQVNMVPGELIANLGDTHIYKNHVDGIKEQLTRSSKDCTPKLVLNKAKDIFSYKFEDFKILDYESHPSIKMNISV